MKKLLVTAALTLSVALTATSAIAGSFQLGTVTELSVSHDRATFQLDTSADQIDIRESCLDSSKELNFIIDFSKVGGAALLDVVREARANDTKLGINGDGVCIGDEQEGVDTIAPKMPPSAS